VTGAVETDTETKRNYGNSEDEDNVLTLIIGEINFKSCLRKVFLLDGAL
jgi:hypothetical protein